VAGVVNWFDADEGWGVIAAPEMPGDCFVHFSSIEVHGYRELHPGQRCGSHTKILDSRRTAAVSAP